MYSVYVENNCIVKISALAVLICSNLNINILMPKPFL
jgi:hypothetical protein